MEKVEDESQICCENEENRHRSDGRRGICGSRRSWRASRCSQCHNWTIGAVQQTQTTVKIQQLTESFFRNTILLKELRIIIFFQWNSSSKNSSSYLSISEHTILSISSSTSSCAISKLCSRLSAILVSLTRQGGLFASETTLHPRTTYST